MSDDQPGHIEGVEHSIIGQVLKRLDGLSASDRPPLENFREIGALVVIRRNGWLELTPTENPKWWVSQVALEWLLSTLQEDTLNEILVARDARQAEADRRAVDPNWGSW